MEVQVQCQLDLDSVTSGSPTQVEDMHRKTRSPFDAKLMFVSPVFNMGVNAVDQRPCGTSPSWDIGQTSCRRVQCMHGMEAAPQLPLLSSL